MADILDIRLLVWSCNPMSEGGVWVCVRTKQWNTAAVRFLTEGYALFLAHNPISFQFICDELLCELREKCLLLSENLDG
jgi:hypothetical protein